MTGIFKQMMRLLEKDFGDALILITEIETETKIFCRNPYNLTGICIWLSAVFSVVVCCYSEVLNLCMKSIERAHIPMNLWEMIKLSRN
ncbi:hypothetical protein YC2023_066811 [Brassica napus]